MTKSEFDVQVQEHLHTFEQCNERYDDNIWAVIFTFKEFAPFRELSFNEFHLLIRMKKYHEHMKDFHGEYRRMYRYCKFLSPLFLDDNGDIEKLYEKFGIREKDRRMNLYKVFGPLWNLLLCADQYFGHLIEYMNAHN